MSLFKVFIQKRQPENSSLPCAAQQNREEPGQYSVPETSRLALAGQP
jgi:hypothetical protein